MVSRETAMDTVPSAVPPTSCPICRTWLEDRSPVLAVLSEHHHRCPMFRAEAEATVGRLTAVADAAAVHRVAVHDRRSFATIIATGWGLDDALAYLPLAEVP